MPARLFNDIVPHDCLESKYYSTALAGQGPGIVEASHQLARVVKPVRAETRQMIFPKKKFQEACRRHTRNNCR